MEAAFFAGGRWRCQLNSPTSEPGFQARSKGKEELKVTGKERKAGNKMELTHGSSF